MKTKHLASLLQKDYTTVQVRFAETVKLYTYKYRGEPIAVGDYAVVKVGPTLKIVKVMAVDAAPRIDVDADFTYQWIVQRIDTTQYDALNASEAAFMDTLQEIEAVKQREQLANDFRDRLPIDSPARILFETAVATLEGPTK